jgi:hypothetical protein
MKKERKNLWSEGQKINWRRKLYSASPITNPFHPFFFKTSYPFGRIFHHLI